MWPFKKKPSKKLDYGNVVNQSSVSGVIRSIQNAIEEKKEQLVCTPVIGNANTFLMYYESIKEAHKDTVNIEGVFNHNRTVINFYYKEVEKPKHHSSDFEILLTEHRLVIVEKNNLTGEYKGSHYVGGNEKVVKYYHDKWNPKVQNIVTGTCKGNLWPKVDFDSENKRHREKLRELLDKYNQERIRGKFTKEGLKDFVLSIVPDLYDDVKPEEPLITKEQYKQELYNLTKGYKESLLKTCNDKDMLLHDFCVGIRLEPVQKLTYRCPSDYVVDVNVEETFKLKD